MKFAIVLFALFAVAAARPNDFNPAVVHQDVEIQPEGFKFEFETSDGKKHQEQGQLKNVGTEQEAIAVKGSYSYTDDEGNVHSVSYTADENGFQPEGADIHKP